MAIQLNTPVEELAGVGAVTAKNLAALGLATAQDLLFYWPRRYDDYSQLKPIAQLRPGLVSVRATVDHINERRSFKRRGMAITEVIVSDKTGSLKLTWFNNRWVGQQLKEGDEYFFLGELKFASNNFGITQPTFESTNNSQLAGKILPVYPESASINSKLLRNLVDQVLVVSKDLTDDVPEVVRTTHQLMSRADAIRQLHQPDSSQDLKSAQDRMGFAELFLLFLAGIVLRREIETEPAIALPFDESLAQQFVQSLTFDLTDGQRASAWQIVSDLSRDRPMNRLLEGDVGSGKTVVAAFAALQVIRAGHQVALMVPTELLARQHLQTFRDLFEKWNVQTELLTSRLSAADKRRVRSEVASGKVELIIGTQALLTSGTDFNELGLVIVDEQHRFGVKQRIALKDKAGRLPHVLTMTATPIPRSLALVVYGDLDISILKDLPPGRKPVQTKVVFDADRVHVYAQLDRRIGAGEQIYIVCPAIDESDQGGIKAASSEIARLKKSVFKHRRLGLMHGRMKSDEKNEIMNQFLAGEIDILVATTVIEVGIHVANASVMVVEQAERFGLATLHQLRGRVGRGNQQAQCFLFTASENPMSIARVKALEKTTDGFRLAQIDLEERGAGERFGLRQSGERELRFAALTDQVLVARVREAAQAFLDAENIVEYPVTLERVNRLKTVTSLD